MKFKNRDSMAGRASDLRYLFEKKFAKPYKKVLCAGSYIYEPIEVGATHACDISEKNGKRLIENGFKGEFKIGDVRSLPYKDKEIDCVLCCEVLEHLGTMDNVKKAISEILRVGKNFLVSVPYKHDIHHNIVTPFFDEEIFKYLFPKNTYVFIHRPFLFASNKIKKWENPNA